MYFMYAASKFDEAKEAYNNLVVHNDNSKIDNVLLKINDASKFIFWKKHLKELKIQLLIRKKEYRKALKYIKQTDAYLYTGLIYEILNKSDSAKIYYEKEIQRQIDNIDDYSDNLSLQLQAERNIGLLYTFVGNNNKAKEYLREIPSEIDSNERKILLQYDFYIENYQSGGYKDFIEGDIISFGIDSISKNIDLDSLIEANRFYYNGYIGSDNKYIYKVKRIFEEKAISCGMNKIENTKANTIYRSQ